MDRSQTAKPLETRSAHFQKDIIIPQIYNLQNIKLIQSCSYPQSPLNKVKQLKKNQIQNIVKAIINKPHIPTSDKHKPTPTHSTVKKAQLHRRTYKQIYQMQTSEGLFMDIDQKIGQMINNMEEMFAPTAERIQNTLSKVGNYIKDKEKEQKQKEVENYLTFISTKRLKTINPQKNKKMKGLIEELQQLRKSGIVAPFRKRAQSAKVIRSTPQSEEFTMRQSKSRLLQRETSNTKQSRRLSAHIVKSQKIITMINSCLGQQEKKKGAYTKSLSQMKQQWGEQGRLQKTLIRSTNFTISSDTLNILRQKRLRQSPLNRMDVEYFKK